MADREEELTPPAKNAIRRYMMALLALPGIFSIIVTFAIGFLVRDIALEKADNSAIKESYKAVQDVYTELMKIMREVSTRDAGSKVLAENVKGETDKTLASLRQLQEQADSLKKQIQTSDLLKAADQNVEKIAAQIVTRKDFIDKIMKEVDKGRSDVEQLRRVVGSLMVTPRKVEEKCGLESPTSAWISCTARCRGGEHVVIGACEAGDTRGDAIAIESTGRREENRGGVVIQGWHCNYVDTRRIAAAPSARQHPLLIKSVAYCQADN
jgi:hypothetical protein